jgi:hypothetical protein
MSGRMEKALAEPGCQDGNWTSTIANVLGYSAEYFAFSESVLACDPLRSLSWFNSSRARLWAGDPVDALRMTREGSEVAPGSWLTMTHLQSLLANDLHDEAIQVIDSEVQRLYMANAFHAMVAAHRSDLDRLAPLIENYDENAPPNFFDIIINAWIGRRDAANQAAAVIDEHYFGPIVLWQSVHWCQCGAPWDLEVTPNFAAKIEEANVPWPLKTPLSFPLKDW